jgi:uncharacterized protein YbjT (DUF2867 family)
MKNKIFITGASGNIGTHIRQQLDNAQANYVIGVTSPEAAALENGSVYANFNDKASLVQAFQDIDTLFLLFPMIAPMIKFAENAVQAAQEAGVQHIVRSSGAGADSALSFKMPNVQGTIDDLIKNSGIPYTLTKPASFMQNFVNFFANDIKSGALYMPTGEGKLSWVDVRDIAAVNATVLQHPQKYTRQELTITGAEDLSYQEAVTIISKVIHKDVQYIDVPEAVAIQAMESAGMPSFAIEMTSSLNQIIKAGYAAGVTDTVEKVTGKAPISFHQFSLDYKESWS